MANWMAWRFEKTYLDGITHKTVYSVSDRGEATLNILWKKSLDRTPAGKWLVEISAEAIFNLLEFWILNAWVIPGTKPLCMSKQINARGTNQIFFSNWFTHRNQLTALQRWPLPLWPDKPTQPPGSDKRGDIQQPERDVSIWSESEFATASVLVPRLYWVLCHTLMAAWKWLCESCIYWVRNRTFQVREAWS